MIPLEELLEDKHTVLWDWNGTLLDDVAFCVRTINGLLTRYGHAPLTLRQYRERFSFPVIEYYRRIGFDFEKTPFETVATEFVVEYERGVGDCQLFAGARDLLARVREAGIDQAVLSAAHQEHLDAQMASHGIGEMFGAVYGLPDHYAAGKVARGRELMRALGAAPETTLLVGDTEHDAEVGRELGVDVVLLADGHHPVERLLATGALVIPSRNP